MHPKALTLAQLRAEQRREAAAACREINGV